VSLVHGDVLEGHRREVDFVHREVVEDAGADEPSDLDGPVLRHPVEFSDTLLMVLQEEENRKVDCEQRASKGQHVDSCPPFSTQSATIIIDFFLLLTLIFRFIFKVHFFYQLYLKP